MKRLVKAFFGAYFSVFIPHPPAFSSESRGAIVCGLQAVWLLQNILGVLIIISVLICYPCNHVHSESVVAFEPHSLSRMLSTLYYHRLYTRTYVWYNIFSD